MQRFRCRVDLNSWRFWISIMIAIILQALKAASIVAPGSNCYVLDDSSCIVDFTSWLGQPFEYDAWESDLVVRFCKDVESRSKTIDSFRKKEVSVYINFTNFHVFEHLYHNYAGYVDFGHFDRFNHFVAGSGQVNFVQGFYNGDLVNCEHSYDKLGQTVQVSIICGTCPNGQCKVGVGCICSVTYESTCRVFIKLTIQCEKPGPRVFKGFTVGFHPRTWEIVYDGMTQLGFERSHQEFSFVTEQTHVALYMTAIASLSTLVQKPIVKTFPDSGLEVRVSGSGASGKPPTTLSPMILVVDWRCQKARDSPYDVNITIPVEGYEPVQFTLTKMCEFTQAQDGDATRGWAIFGVLSCIFLILSTLFCCGGFIYKTRVQRQHGIDALPGMTILSACLETASGAGQGYTRAEDINSTFVSEASWERPPVSAQGRRRQSERKYGAI